MGDLGWPAIGPEGVGAGPAPALSELYYIPPPPPPCLPENGCEPVETTKVLLILYLVFAATGAWLYFCVAICNLGTTRDDRFYRDHHIEFLRFMDIRRSGPCSVREAFVLCAKAVFFGICFPVMCPLVMIGMTAAIVFEIARRLYKCPGLLRLHCRQRGANARRNAENAAAEAQRLRNLPANQPWLRRGWLVMMRARHQKSLERPVGSLARLRRCLWNPRKFPYANPSVSSRVSDIELLEVGRERNSPAWVVFTVAELEEEGLFRHIVKYL